MHNLNKKVKNILRKENIPFLCFMIAMFFIHFKISIAVGSDDSYYIKAWDGVNLSNFQDLFMKYLSLNNRVLINIAIATIIRLDLWVWKILNITIFTGLMYLISNLTNFNKGSTEQERLEKNTFLCIIVFFVHYNVLSSGAYWITGSFNYLWTTAFCFIGLIPFKKLIFNEEIKNKLLIWSSIFALYACYFEQTAAILLCFGILSLIFSKLVLKKKIHFSLMIYYGFILINCLILLLLPFNEGRFVGEIGAWYPNFPMLSFVDKLYQGTTHLFNHIINNTSLIMFIITGMIFAILFKKYNDSIIRSIASIPVVYFSLRILPFNKLLTKSFNYPMELDDTFYNVLYNFNNNVFEKIVNKVDYLPFIVGGTVILLIPFLIYAIYENTKESFYLIILYFAGIAASVVLSFSPTIFGSGNRIFFVTDFILILISGALFEKFYKCLIKQRVFYKIFIAFLGLIVIGLIIQTALYLSNTIYY